jgi:hypothetical protein
MAAIYLATQCRSSGNHNVKFTDLKIKVILNYISRFSWYRTVNTLSPDNKNHQIRLCREIIALCFQNNKECINVVCGKTQYFFVVETKGTTRLERVSFLVMRESVLKYWGISLKTEILLDVSV